MYKGRALLHCHFFGGIHEAVLCCNVLLVATAAAAVVTDDKCNMSIWNNDVVDHLDGANSVMRICLLS